MRRDIVLSYHIHGHGLVLRHAIDKVSRRQMPLFHAVYVNGKIPAISGCQISDLITGFIYYVCIFSTRISELAPVVIHYALIVLMVLTISTGVAVQFTLPKNVGSIGTWSILLSGPLLVDFIHDLYQHSLLRTLLSLSRFIHSIITSRIILDIRKSIKDGRRNRIRYRPYK